MLRRPAPAGQRRAARFGRPTEARLVGGFLRALRDERLTALRRAEAGGIAR
jgi:hypothetical protein